MIDNFDRFDEWEREQLRRERLREREEAEYLRADQEEDEYADKSHRYLPILGGKRREIDL